MNIESVFNYSKKIAKYLFCGLLIAWCLIAFEYNLFITKEYLLALVWLCGLSFPVSLLFSK